MREAPARVNRNKLLVDMAGNQSSPKDIGCGLKKEPIANRWLKLGVTLAQLTHGENVDLMSSHFVLFSESSGRHQNEIWYCRKVCTLPDEFERTKQLAL